MPTSRIEINAVSVDIENQSSDIDYSKAFEAEELAIKKLETDVRREELNGQTQDRTQRKQFATMIFWLLVGFLSITLLIVIANGFCYFPFTLDNSILITLLATSSANVIGIFIFVVKYLFKANVCPNCGIRVTQNQTINH